MIDSNDMESQEISIYRDAFQQQTKRNLTFGDFLIGVQRGQWRQQVEAVRMLTETAQIKEAKKRVPAVTPSGLFSGRGAAAIIQHSGILCLDLDSKDNPDIAKPAARTRVYADQYIYAGHVSISGRGLSLYVQIDPEQHEIAYTQLEQYFRAAWGVVSDPACKDVSRLRFVSHDTALYHNPEARCFQAWRPGQARRSIDRPAVEDSAQHFEVVLSQIISAGHDMTANYANWVKIGFAIASEFEESGREYFHALSQYYPAYKPKETDMQYTRCLRRKGSGVTIRSFFWLAQQAGFTIKSKMT